MANRLLTLFRRIWGTQQLWDIRELLTQQRQMMILLGNSLRYRSADLEKLRKSTVYKRGSTIISLLSPMDVKNGNYIRVGRDNDGGYVMLDGFQTGKVDAAYGFGVSDDVSWDEAIANYGIQVFMYDPTINRLPKRHPNFHFFKLGVTGHEKIGNYRTLGEIIAANGHTKCSNMLMKMDVEGSEWGVFAETEPSVISQFSQILVEFHYLSSAVDGQKYLNAVNVLEKLNRTHQIIHVHPNNWWMALCIGDLILPDMLEVTYVRRADVKDRLIPNTREFPTDRDHPDVRNLHDIYLGDFAGDESEKKR